MFHGTTEAWERMEAPLGRLDATLEGYAREHGLALSRNSRGWPERSLSWGTGVKRLIQVFLADEASLTLNIWICASEDRGAERFWKQRFVRKDSPVEALAGDLSGLLDSARREVESWTSGDLEPAGTAAERS